MVLKNALEIQRLYAALKHIWNFDMYVVTSIPSHFCKIFDFVHYCMPLYNKLPYLLTSLR